MEITVTLNHDEIVEAVKDWLEERREIVVPAYLEHTEVTWNQAGASGPLLGLVVNFHDRE